MGIALTAAAFAMISTASVNPAAIMPTELISRLYPLETTLKTLVQKSGYFHIKASKPDTLGVCVGETPTSLIAWLVHLATVSPGDVTDTTTTYVFTPEQFLDFAMNYWVTEKNTTAFRIYAESFNLRNYRIGYINVPTTVPTVIVQAAHEIVYMPPSALNTKFQNLVAVDVLEKYGHFLALQAPQDFPKLVLSGLQRIIKIRENNNM